MNTEKKNQHYIPKFYLRNFSFQNNKKQIGVFNIHNELYVSQAKLKTQGSKNFFYGNDGIIEDNLSIIEGVLSNTINKVITTKTLPKKSSKEHIELLLFASLTDLRNPVRIENMKSMMQQAKSMLLEIDPKTDTEKVFPSLTHDEIIKFSLSNIHEMVKYTVDLDYKLLMNDTNKPFISSDFPVIKYNQFLEFREWSHAKTGYGTVGLQIFIPLNSEILLMFFDSNIYKVGDKKQQTYTISRSRDVDELNKLQFVNCLETIFFNDNASESYIRDLSKQSKKHKRGNIPTSELSFIFSEGDDKQKIIASGQRNLMYMGNTDCAINLKINGIKIHSKGHSHKLHPSMAQLRPLPAMLRNDENNE